MTADIVSIQTAFYGVAAAMFVSGGIALAWMRETHPMRGGYVSSGESEPSIPDDD